MVAAILLLTSLGCSADPRPRPEHLPPNLLIVLIDTLRADHLGVYGYERETSPHLDELARRCTAFEAAQSVSPWTAPALLSLMTSLEPNVHGITAFPNPGRMSERITTLAEILKARGYAAAAFTEGGYAKAEFGLGQGFDHFPKNPGDDESHGSNLIHPSRLEGNLERSLSWIERHRSQPFFVFFHTYEPHEPYRAPDRFISRFRPSWNSEEEHAEAARAVRRWNAERRLSAQEFERIVRHLYHCRLRDLPAIEDSDAFRRYHPEPLVSWQSVHRDPDFVGWVRDLYDAEIAFTDDRLTRLWDGLEELDLLRHTYVVVVSDHGEGLGDHDQLTHGLTLHDEVLRIALLVCTPGDRFQPRRLPSVVTSLDVMPTLLDLLSIPATDLTLQGRSLVPLMDGGALPESPAFGGALSEKAPERLISIRTTRWRMTLETATTRRWLYDLKQDPDATYSVASYHPEVVRDLTGLIRARQQHGRALSELLEAEVEDGDLDPATLRELRALGYIDESNATSTR